MFTLCLPPPTMEFKRKHIVCLVICIVTRRFVYAWTSSAMAKQISNSAPLCHQTIYSPAPPGGGWAESAQPASGGGSLGGLDPTVSERSGPIVFQALPCLSPWEPFDTETTGSAKNIPFWAQAGARGGSLGGLGPSVSERSGSTSFQALPCVSPWEPLGTEPTGSPKHRSSGPGLALPLLNSAAGAVLFKIKRRPARECDRHRRIRTIALHAAGIHPFSARNLPEICHEMPRKPDYATPVATFS